MTVQDLPHVNAALNGLATSLILAGYFFVRRRNVRAHVTCMLSAFAVSTVFLVCYLIYHHQAGHVTFTHGGAVRWFYLFILISHIVLAAVTPFLVIGAIVRGLQGRIDRHRRIVRWALPIWLYVSVTGVIVYAMLYHLYPPDGKPPQSTVRLNREPTSQRTQRPQDRE